MNSTSTACEKELATKHVRKSTGKHACANCGALISDAYEFCTRNVFGKIIEDRCRKEFEQYWSAAAQRIAALAQR